MLQEGLSRITEWAMVGGHLVDPLTLLKAALTFSQIAQGLIQGKI